MGTLIAISSALICLAGYVLYKIMAELREFKTETKCELYRIKSHIDLSESIITNNLSFLTAVLTDMNAKLSLKLDCPDSVIMTRTEKAASASGWPMLKTADGRKVARLNPKSIQELCGVDVYHIDDCEVFLTIRRSNEAKK